MVILSTDLCPHSLEICLRLDPRSRQARVHLGWAVRPSPSIRLSLRTSDWHTGPPVLTCSSLLCTCSPVGISGMKPRKAKPHLEVGGLSGPQRGPKPTSRRQALEGQEKPGLLCLGWSL